MDSQYTALQLHERKYAPTYIERKVVELLSILLADVASDAEVAARDSGIADASFVRLRRAMDRVACAQRLLETVRAESASVKGGEPVMRMQMREAVELLARGWPEDYPDGAVEWLLWEQSENTAREIRLLR
jgi:hypothetical protein